MAKQRYINTHFWDDTFIVNLDPIEKLLFLYLLTNPLTNIAGAYEVTLRRMAFDTGIDSDMILKILARFEAADKVIFQDGWILIKNFIKNQSLSPKIIKGIEDSVNCCPHWIKDTLSIKYERLSHLNSNLNSNINSNSASDTPSAELPEENPNAEFDAAKDNFLSAVRATYNTSILSREDRWVETIGKAITAEISTDVFIGELEKLLADTSRKYNITPENVLTAAIEARAKKSTPSIPTAKPQFENRNAEIEARGFPKMAVVSEAAH